MESNKLTELCQIAYQYGTDKCPQIKHAYTPFYYNLLKTKRQSIKKVLELGIGHYRDMQKNPTTFDKGLNRTYHRGASLYMWRDFFPNAMIFGADIRPETQFEDERIKTYIFDERKQEDIKRLIENIGSDIDLVVDDASHHVNDQIFLAQTILPLFNSGTTYVIEDVSHSRKISKALSGYKCFVYDPPRIWHGGMLFVVNT